MSAVWIYFNGFTENDGSPTATCNICNAAISQNGNVKATFNTNSMIRHLKRNHLKEYNDFLWVIEAKATLKQPTLKYFSNAREVLPRNWLGPKKRTNKLTDFIELDDLPISVFENVCFHRLLELLGLRYEVCDHLRVCSALLLVSPLTFVVSYLRLFKLDW